MNSPVSGRHMPPSLGAVNPWETVDPSLAWLCPAEDRPSPSGREASLRPLTDLRQ